MAYWLLKSEPESFSIDDLRRVKVEHWDGVRNYVARNNLRAMKKGELAFFYHSNAKPPGIAGICAIEREAYPDHTAFDPSSKYFDPKSSPEKPRWFMPDVRFVEKFGSLIPLDELRATPGLGEMALFTTRRLSVQPVTDEEWEIITALAERA
jgi:predicted RNA-binding protein with PUA-like domain